MRCSYRCNMWCNCKKPVRHDTHVTGIGAPSSSEISIAEQSSSAVTFSYSPENASAPGSDIVLGVTGNAAEAAFTGFENGTASIQIRGMSVGSATVWYQIGEDTSTRQTISVTVEAQPTPEPFTPTNRIIVDVNPVAETRATKSKRGAKAEAIGDRFVARALVADRLNPNYVQLEWIHGETPSVSFMGTANNDHCIALFVEDVNNSLARDIEDYYDNGVMESGETQFNPSTYDNVIVPYFEAPLDPETTQRVINAVEHTGVGVVDVTIDRNLSQTSGTIGSYINIYLMIPNGGGVMGDGHQHLEVTNTQRANEPTYNFIVTCKIIELSRGYEHGFTTFTYSSYNGNSDSIQIEYLPGLHIDSVSNFTPTGQEVRINGAVDPYVATYNYSPANAYWHDDVLLMNYDSNICMLDTVYLSPGYSAVFVNTDYPMTVGTTTADVYLKGEDTGIDVTVEVLPATIPVESVSNLSSDSVYVEIGDYNSVTLDYLPVDANAYNNISFSHTNPNSIVDARVDSFENGTMRIGFYPNSIGNDRVIIELNGQDTGLYVDVEVAEPPMCDAYLTTIETESVTVAPSGTATVSFGLGYDCADPQYGNISVSSNDESVATVSMVLDAEDGELTISGVSEGTTTIVLSDGTNSYYINVAVATPVYTVDALVNLPQSYTAYIGYYDTRHAYYTPANAANPQGEIAITSSDTSIVEIDNEKMMVNGEIHFGIRGVSEGNANVVFTLANGNVYTIPTVSIVRPVDWISNISTNSVQLSAGNSTSVSFNYSPNWAGDFSLISVISNDENVATVTEPTYLNGEATFSIVGVAEGTTAVEVMFNGTTTFSIDVETVAPTPGYVVNEHTMVYAPLKDTLDGEDGDGNIITPDTLRLGATLEDGSARFAANGALRYNLNTTISVTPMTVSLWVKPSFIDDWLVAWHHADWTNVGVSNDNQWFTTDVQGWGDYFWGLANEGWNLLTIVYDSPNNLQEIYVNGENVGGISYNYNVSQIDKIYLGARGYNDNNIQAPWNGYVSDFIVEDIAWTGQMVSDYYEATKDNYSYVTVESIYDYPVSITLPETEAYGFSLHYLPDNAPRVTEQIHMVSSNDSIARVTYIQKDGDGQLDFGVRGISAGGAELRIFVNDSLEAAIPVTVTPFVHVESISQGELTATVIEGETGTYAIPISPSTVTDCSQDITVVSDDDSVAYFSGWAYSTAGEFYIHGDSVGTTQLHYYLNSDPETVYDINVTISPLPYTPGENTVFYYPFIGHEDDVTGLSYLSSGGDPADIGHVFNIVNQNDCTVINSQDGMPAQANFISAWIKWNESLAATAQSFATYMGEILFNFAHSQPAYNKAFQAHVNNHWPHSDTQDVIPGMWYHFAVGYDASNNKAIAYINGQKVWEELNISNPAIGSTPLGMAINETLSDLIGESQCWTDEQVSDYYEATKDSYPIPTYIVQFATNDPEKGLVDHVTIACEVGTPVVVNGNEIIIGEDTITATAEQGNFFFNWLDAPQVILGDVTITANFFAEGETPELSWSFDSVTQDISIPISVPGYKVSQIEFSGTTGGIQTRAGMWFGVNGGTPTVDEYYGTYLELGTNEDYYGLAYYGEYGKDGGWTRPFSTPSLGYGYTPTAFASVMTKDSITYSYGENESTFDFIDYGIAESIKKLLVRTDLATAIGPTNAVLNNAQITVQYELATTVTELQNVPQSIPQTYNMSNSYSFNYLPIDADIVDIEITSDSGNVQITDQRDAGNGAYIFELYGVAEGQDTLNVYLNGSLNTTIPVEIQSIHVDTLSGFLENSITVGEGGHKEVHLDITPNVVSNIAMDITLWNGDGSIVQAHFVDASSGAINVYGESAGQTQVHAYLNSDPGTVYDLDVTVEEATAEYNLYQNDGTETKGGYSPLVMQNTDYGDVAAQCTKFSGGNSAAYTGNMFDDSEPLQEDFSWVGWVRFEEGYDSETRVIFSKGDGGWVNDSNFSLVMLPSKNLQLSTGPGGMYSTQDFDEVPFAPVLKKWYHIGYTLNWSTNEINLYIDGQLVETWTPDIAPGTTGTQFMIGRYHNNRRGSFVGYMNEIMFTKKELSALEISDIYDAQASSHTNILPATISGPSENSISLEKYEGQNVTFSYTPNNVEIFSGLVISSTDDTIAKAEIGPFSNGTAAINISGMDVGNATISYYLDSDPLTVYTISVTVTQSSSPYTPTQDTIAYFPLKGTVADFSGNEVPIGNNNWSEGNKGIIFSGGSAVELNRGDIKFVGMWYRASSDFLSDSSVEGILWYKKFGELSYLFSHSSSTRKDLICLWKGEGYTDAVTLGNMSYDEWHYFAWGVDSNGDLLVAKDGSIYTAVENGTGYDFGNDFKALRGVLHDVEISDLIIDGATWDTQDMLDYYTATYDKYHPTVVSVISSNDCQGTVSSNNIESVDGETGIVSGNTVTVSGTTVTATASSGFAFDHWEDDNGNTVTSTFTVYTGLMLTAYFTQTTPTEITGLSSYNNEGYVGNTDIIEVYFSPAGGDFSNITAVSSDPTVVDVDTIYPSAFCSYVICQFTYNSLGTATLTFSDGTNTEVANISVVTAATATITGLSTNSLSIGGAGMDMVVYYYTPNDASDFSNITVTSDDSNVARGEVELYNPGVISVYGLSDGNCTLTISDGTNSYQVSVTVDLTPSPCEMDPCDPDCPDRDPCACDGECGD